MWMPYLWAVVQGSPFLCYFGMGFLTAVIIAAIEGHEGEKEMSGWVFFAFFVWPADLVIGAVCLLYISCNAAFSHGKKQK